MIINRGNIIDNNCCTPVSQTDCYKPCAHKHDDLYYDKRKIDIMLKELNLSAGAKMYFGQEVPTGQGKIGDVYFLITEELTTIYQKEPEWVIKGKIVNTKIKDRENKQYNKGDIVVFNYKGIQHLFRALVITTEPPANDIEIDPDWEILGWDVQLETRLSTRIDAVNERLDLITGEGLHYDEDGKLNLGSLVRVVEGVPTFTNNITKTVNITSAITGGNDETYIAWLMQPEAGNIAFISTDYHEALANYRSYVQTTATSNEIISASSSSPTGTPVQSRIVTNLSGISLSTSEALYIGAPAGAQYPSDLSANYTDRSLIDKGYLLKTVQEAVDPLKVIYGQGLNLKEDGTLNVGVQIDQSGEVDFTGLFTEDTIFGYASQEESIFSVATFGKTALGFTFNHPYNAAASDFTMSGNGISLSHQQTIQDPEVGPWSMTAGIYLQGSAKTVHISGYGGTALTIYGDHISINNLLKLNFENLEDLLNFDGYTLINKNYFDKYNILQTIKRTDNKIGYRIKNNSPAGSYAEIGEGAIDFSYVNNNEVNQGAYGAYSVAFGRNNRVNAYNSVVFGSGNLIIDGSSDIAVFGYGNKAQGSASFVTGNNNIADGQSSIFTGANNKQSSGQNAIIGGSYNTADGSNNLMIGSYNTTDPGTNDSIIGGARNEVAQGMYRALVVGDSNKVKQGSFNSIVGGTLNDFSAGSRNSLAIGENNKSLQGAANNLLSGEDNVVSNGSSENLIVGKGNTAVDGEGKFTTNTIMAGQDNRLFGSSNSLIAGIGNISNNDDVLIIGRYNEDIPKVTDSDYATRRAFIIGNGYKTAGDPSITSRLDSFYILGNGHAIYGDDLSTEFTDRSLVDKGYVDGRQVLISITEGINTGQRLKGFNVNYFGDIGTKATDFSIEHSIPNSSPFLHMQPYITAGTMGATGRYAFAAGGANVASGSQAFATGLGNLVTGASSFSAGQGCQATGSRSAVFNDANIASGIASFSTGSTNNVSGNQSGAFAGFNNAVSGINSASLAGQNNFVLSNGSAVISSSASTANANFASLITTSNCQVTGNGSSIIGSGSSTVAGIQSMVIASQTGIVEASIDTSAIIASVNSKILKAPGTIGGRNQAIIASDTSTINVGQGTTAQKWNNAIIAAYYASINAGMSYNLVTGQGTIGTASAQLVIGMFNEDEPHLSVNNPLKKAFIIGGGGNTMTTGGDPALEDRKTVLYVQHNGDLVNTGTIKTTQYKLSTLNAAPASATATGVLGETRITADYIYVCTATNVWKRAALTTW